MASRRTLAQVGESETEVPAGFLDGDLELVEPSAQHEATTSVRSTRVVPTRSGTSSKESQPDPDSTCCAEPEGEFDHTADVKLPSPVELECADELDINLLFALLPVFFEECTRSHHSFHSSHSHERRMFRQGTIKACNCLHLAAVRSRGRFAGWRVHGHSVDQELQAGV